MSWMSAWWQQVSGTATQGLQITFVGMSLVFITLGLIILVLVALTRLPGLRPQRVEQVQDERPEPQSARSEPPVERETALSPASTDPDLAQVAAIAVALLRSQRSRGKRTRPRPTASNWKQYGRAHQLGL